MGDIAVRFMVVAAIASVVVLVSWLLHRRTTRARRLQLPADLGPFPVVFYFGDEACASCLPAAAAIEQAGLRVRTITWGADATVFERLGVEEVPALWGVGADGRLVNAVHGIPTPRDLARLKSQQSPE